MKRDVDQLNLCSAFSPEPEECHDALMVAARSVKEEPKPAAQAWLRTLAFAVSQAGLLDWLCQDMGVEAPSSASDVLAATEQTTYTVDPLTMTISETLADGRLAYLTVNVASKDGPVLICEGSGDPYDPVGATLAKALNNPDITAETPMAQAAQETGLPLYSAMAWLQLEEGVGDGTEMMDALRREVPRIAITVDDCYDIKQVQAAIDLCTEHQITMTFFPIGNALKFADGPVWQTALDAGCEIGNHTWGHTNLTNKSSHQVRYQMLRTQQKVDEMLGYHYPMQVMRPPMGKSN